MVAPAQWVRRNRYRACEAADIEPWCEEYDGDDPLGYVVSLNLRRRRLDASQRAMVAARIANLQGRQRKSGLPIGEAVTQGEAADLLNVGKRSVERARTVLEHGQPELIAMGYKGSRGLHAT